MKTPTKPKPNRPVVTQANDPYHVSIVSYILPLTLLTMGFSFVVLTMQSAATPLLGTVLAFRHIDLITTSVLLTSWLVCLIQSGRLYIKNFVGGINKQQPSSSSRQTEEYFFATINWTLCLCFVVALAPLTRDLSIQFANNPAQFAIDYIVQPLSQIIPKVGIPKFGPIFESITQQYLNPYMPYFQHALPAWVHPHCCYLFSLYLPAAITGKALASIPFLTVSNYYSSRHVHRHFLFSLMCMPVIWAIITHLVSGLGSVAIEKQWIYPDTFLAGLCLSTAIAVGVCVPLVCKPVAGARKNKYLHVIFTVLIFGVIGQLFSSGRGHYERDIDNPIHLDNDYTVLAKRGINQIITDTSRGIRVMRAGHSLIGGVYQSAGDSVFAGFYYHDAHRFITGRPLAKYDPGMSESSTSSSSIPKGLMIGYGVGIAAQMYAQLGIPLDVVEIDGLVLDLAKQYFPLPRRTHNVTYIVDDGTAYIRKVQGSTYDFVIHDVFSGGSVPSRLFSWQTVAHMKRILKPGGTLSMNLVGRPHDLAFRHVAKTIRSVFKYVRCFAEITDNTPPNGVINLVFFASTLPMDFRPSDPARDAFESAIRAYSHSIRAANEIKLPGPPRTTTGIMHQQDDGLYYEWSAGDTLAADTDASEFCSPKPLPVLDKRTNSYIYKLPVNPPKPVIPGPNGPDKETVKVMPHVLLDDEPSDRLSEALVDVAMMHYSVMHDVIPLHVWLFY